MRRRPREGETYSGSHRHADEGGPEEALLLRVKGAGRARVVALAAQDVALARRRLGVVEGVGITGAGRAGAVGDKQVGAERVSERR